MSTEPEIVVEDKRSASLAKVVEPDSSLLNVMERFATNPNLDADKIEKLFNIFIDGQRKMRVMNDEQEFAIRWQTSRGTLLTSSKAVSLIVEGWAQSLVQLQLSPIWTHTQRPQCQDLLSAVSRGHSHSQNPTESLQ